MTKRRLGTKIALYCVGFALILLLVLGTVGYTAYKTSLIERYEVHTRSLLETACSAVDGDGLLSDIQQGTEGEAYLEAQDMICRIKVNTDISYIYIVSFPDPSTHKQMNFVMNGFSPEEVADDPDYVSHIGDVSVLGEVGDPDADFDYATTKAFWDSLYGDPTDEVRFYVNDTDIYGYQMTGFKPIYASDGTGVGVIALDVSMDEIKSHLNNYLFTLIIAALLLLVVFLAVLLTALNKSVIRPVTGLAMSAQDFVNQSKEAEEDPEKLVFRQVPVKSQDEIRLLSENLTMMTDELRSYMVNLKSVVGEKERISAELDLATNIQVSMLPSIFPAFPDRPEVDIYATMTPAKEVGGDFYDYFFVDDDHLVVVVADVSGKGVPAALFMVIAKTLIKNNALAGLPLGEVFTRTNNQLCENNGTGLFVTAWAAMIEISTGKTTFVNAGHNPPLLKRKDGQFEYLRSRPGFVLAGMEGVRYRQNEIELDVGDTLFLYTDGVTEAADSKYELYGETRLVDSLNAMGDVNATQMLLIEAADVESFVAGAPQSDDITMVGLRIMSR